MRGTKVLRLAVLVVAVAALVQSTDCWAGRAPAKPSTPVYTPPPLPSWSSPLPPPAVLGSSPEQKQVTEMRTLFAAGEYDKVIASAQAYIASGKEDPTKTEAVRLIAESLRKKGEWKQLPAAYQRLRDRHDKAKEEWFRLDGVLEAVRACPNGVYAAGGTSGGPKPVAPAPAPASATGTDDAASGSLAGTIADDAVLMESLTRVAVNRLKSLRPRITAINSARTLQDVNLQFQAAADVARQILVVSPDVPPDSIREVGIAAGTRLQTLSINLVKFYQDKLAHHQGKMSSPTALTMNEETDITASGSQCKALSAQENKFQEILASVEVKSGWTDGDRLRKESNDRRALYDSLAGSLVVPHHIHSGWDF